MSHPLIKPLEQLLHYLQNSQGGDLKSLIDDDKKGPDVSDDVPDPKGVKVESLELMKPKDDASKDDSAMPDPASFKKGDLLGASEHAEGMKDDDELSDDELKELLAKYC